ncbi:N-acetyltransferase [Pseudoalteromonas sp. KS88]|uniref:GNAT family N-acetyltransferase n=1 Tax=Pseudoalteromonas sp. KS88 TaxID=2109918 RepID=UPI0010813632|nr:GNAT family N-acetyltransferase [Pseudoalteromonas sp. KS88]TGE83694.1 N-acetyltransferase [Pseudoalteromonas sp. KS88]
MYTLQIDNSVELNRDLRSHVVAYNVQHFDAQRIPLGFKVVDDEELIAGISGHVFGNWLIINWLWCSEAKRSQGLATKLLKTLESAAKESGANVSQLDTLDFQAKPFYEKNGYVVKYQMDTYPLNGTRYFMEKRL